MSFKSVFRQRFRSSLLRERSAIQNPFVQKAGQEPYGSIVQPDDAVDIEACPAVVPGAHIAFFQKASGQVFREENGAGIDGAAYPEAFFPQQPGDGSQKGSHPVYGKHPYGRAAFQFHLAPLKGFEAGPENLQTPADQPA